MNLAGKAAKRLVLETLGWLLLIGGIAALVLPGPGLLLIFGGMALLSQQYSWAEKRVDFVKHKALLAAAEGVETWPRMVMSTLGSFCLLAFGVLWILQPPAPDWWPLSDTFWLPGGLTAGITLIVSFAIAFGMIIYSYRHFRGPEGERNRAALSRSADDEKQEIRQQRDERRDARDQHRDERRDARDRHSAERAERRQGRP